MFCLLLTSSVTWESPTPVERTHLGKAVDPVVPFASLYVNLGTCSTRVEFKVTVQGKEAGATLESSIAWPGALSWGWGAFS